MVVKTGVTRVVRGRSRTLRVSRSTTLHSGGRVGDLSSGKEETLDKGMVSTPPEDSGVVPGGGVESGLRLLD